MLGMRHTGCGGCFSCPEESEVFSLQACQTRMFDKLSYYCPLSMLLKNCGYYPAKCSGQKGKRKGRICYNDRCTFQKNSL